MKPSKAIEKLNALPQGVDIDSKLMKEIQKIPQDGKVTLKQRIDLFFLEFDQKKEDEKKAFLENELGPMVLEYGSENQNTGIEAIVNALLPRIAKGGSKECVNQVLMLRPGTQLTSQAWLDIVKNCSMTMIARIDEHHLQRQRLDHKTNLVSPFVSFNKIDNDSIAAAAFARNDDDMVKFLVERNVTFDALLCNMVQMGTADAKSVGRLLTHVEDAFTALVSATESLKPDMVRLLLEQKTDPAKKTMSGDNLLHCLVMATKKLVWADYAGWKSATAILTLLQKHCPQLMTQANAQGVTPLNLGLDGKSLYEVVTTANAAFYEKLGADFSSALHQAILKEACPSLVFFLNHGANLTHANALVAAVQVLNANLVEYLFEREVSIASENAAKLRDAQPVADKADEKKSVITAAQDEDRAIAAAKKAYAGQKVFPGNLLHCLVSSLLKKETITQDEADRAVSIFRILHEIDRTLLNELDKEGYSPLIAAMRGNMHPSVIKAFVLAGASFHPVSRVVKKPEEKAESSAPKDAGSSAKIAVQTAQVNEIKEVQGVPMFEVLQTLVKGTYTPLQIINMTLLLVLLEPKKRVFEKEIEKLRLALEWSHLDAELIKALSALQYHDVSAKLVELGKFKESEVATKELAAKDQLYFVQQLQEHLKSSTAANTDPKVLFSELEYKGATSATPFKDAILHVILQHIFDWEAELPLALCRRLNDLIRCLCVIATPKEIIGAWGEASLYRLVSAMLYNAAKTSQPPIIVEILNLFKTCPEVDLHKMTAEVAAKITTGDVISYDNSSMRELLNFATLSEVPDALGVPALKAQEIARRQMDFPVNTPTQTLPAFAEAIKKSDKLKALQVAFNVKTAPDQKSSNNTPLVELWRACRASASKHAELSAQMAVVLNHILTSYKAGLDELVWMERLKGKELQASKVKVEERFQSAVRAALAGCLLAFESKDAQKIFLPIFCKLLCIPVDCKPQALVEAFRYSQVQVMSQLGAMVGDFENFLKQSGAENNLFARVTACFSTPKPAASHSTHFRLHPHSLGVLRVMQPSVTRFRF